MRVKVLAVMLLFAAVPCLAQEKIGEVVDGLFVDSARPDAVEILGNGSERREFVVVEPDSGFVKLHFTDFALGAGESLTVRDGGYKALETFDGKGIRETGSFWAMSVPGDTVILDFKSRGTGSFTVDRVARGFADPFQIESTCPGNGNDYTGVACAGNLSGPGSYLTPDLKGAVAHLRFVKESGGVYYCSGSVVSADGHLLTNEHCFSDHNQAQCDSYEVYFKREDPDCSATRGVMGPMLRCTQLVKYNYELDYALFQMDGYPGQHLTLTDRPLTVGEDLFVIQHPHGYPKKVSEDVVLLTKVEGRAPDTDLSYQAETAGGSSGSPVFDGNGHVIGLHHFGGCSDTEGNQGVRMELILPEIADIINAPATRTAGVR